MAKKMMVWLGIGIAVAGAAEIAARCLLGLGDPPVSVADAEIDYLFAPNQDCRRFGNRIVYNNLSMRCDFDVDENCRTSRVYVVGDSVVNGGALTDHEALATTLLQRALPQVQVCNVSAGSWGPGNCAAYFRRHPGLRGGTLIVEVNSHDLWEDDPAASGGRSVGRDATLPDRKPWCALWDGVGRYLVPRVRGWLGLASVNTKVDVPKWGEDADGPVAVRNLGELDWLFGQDFDGRVLIIHRTRIETRAGEKVSPGEARLRQWARQRGVTCRLLELDAERDYRDSIHLNEKGQEKLYRLMKSFLELRG